MKLKFTEWDLHLAHTWTIARTKGTNTIKVVVVELSDANGIQGLGEAAPVIRYGESVQTVKAFLSRIDPGRLSFDDYSGSAQYLHSLSTKDMSAKCAVDTALMDGAARRDAKPVHDFLNLGFRERQHLTSFTIGIDTPDVIRRKVLAAEQYPVLKMKVGVAADRENLQALRDIAPTKPVRADANEGWQTKEEALRNLELLAGDGGIEFVEQPLPAATSAPDWRWLKERSPLPIFADESYHVADDVDGIAECFHGVNVKLVKAGGIGPALKALQAARRAGLKTMIGCMIETSVLISAAGHLVEQCDYCDLDGSSLITNDPYLGMTTERGILSFAHALDPIGLRVGPRLRPIPKSESQLAQL